MNHSTFQRKNHKRGKMIVIFLIVFSVIMISLFGYLLYLNIQSQPLIEYPIYTLSTTEWTSSNVVITVDSQNGRAGSYSFDGGKNYQDDNSYEVLTNGDFFITVKDIHGRVSKTIPVSIKNIDKEAPIISFENPITVQLGSNFSLRSGVQVYDEGSGLSNNYITVPDKIDVSIPGVYTVRYTAFDKVGNYTEKERQITVADIQGKTYYRYRTATVESYPCEPYLCNCVVSKSAFQNQTCPSGYTFNAPDKCCQTCYKTCKKTNWSEWSEWSQEKVTATPNREVETKIIE